jgi:peptidoglycan/LPS O-acetylase OafA/YrhL
MSGQAVLAPSGPRLAGVDALRGVAAIAVVLFHYTTRFSELYGQGQRASLSFPQGHLGVQLFFIISGFVIFMTLERTRQPMDFVVSRFSRLFPSYWFAIALTFTVVSAFGLPDKEVTGPQALANVFMLHSFFRVPNVDSVYWTLEVEMLFYIGMFLLFVTRRLHRVHVALWLVLTLRVVYDVAHVHFNIDFSWMLGRVLIIKHIPWFALGICVYQALTRSGGGLSRPAWVTVALALGSLLWVDGVFVFALATVLALLVWAAAGGRLPFLGHPVLVFFGAISYPLYLTHENIGWVLQRELQTRGVSFDVSVLCALAMAVSLAAVITFLVERPAMKAIRSAYQRRRKLAAA